MADIFTKARRSWNMSRIKGKNTKPELLLRSLLHRTGFRFRLHDKKLPGKPISYCRATKLSYLLMDVSGIGIRAADMPILQNPGRSSGIGSLRQQ